MAYKDLEKQKEYQRKWQQARNLAVKLAVVKMMGGECVRCGIKDFRVLQIDHIRPILRKNGGSSATNMTRLIHRGIVPLNEVQLLCANCHSVKTYEEDRPNFGTMFVDKYNFKPKVHKV